MLNKCINTVFFLATLCCANVFAGADVPPMMPSRKVVLLSPFVEGAQRELFGRFMTAIRTGDVHEIRSILEEGQELDCLHLPGVTINGVDINAIELALICRQPAVTRFLLIFARDNHILTTLNLHRLYQVAIRTHDIEAAQLIQNELWVPSALSCVFQ